jgi:hypothetical protein
MLDPKGRDCYTLLRYRARSSGGERLLGMEKVGGSIPPGSTSDFSGAGSLCLRLFASNGGSRL